MTALVFAITALHLAGASAPGVPGFDDVTEVVLVPGEAAFQTRGLFTSSSKGLMLKQPLPWGDAYALWSSPTLADGLVRARFVVGAGFRADVLVRANADVVADGGLDEIDGGYLVSIDTNVVRLARLEHRMNRQLGAEEKLESVLRPGATIEVVVMAMGPWLTATVYDDAFRRLAHVAALDRGFAAGSVGVRLPRIAGTIVEHLSVAARPATTPPTATGDLDMRGDVPGAPGPGAGVERLVSIKTADLPRLPPALRPQVTTTEGDVTFLDTDPVGIELLRRAGITLISHKTQMPFLHKDATLRRFLGKAPTKTSRGFKVDESYKDAAMVEALVRAYAERFPTITRLVELGTSVEGRPIVALVITKGGEAPPGRPSVLFDAGHHGGELLSTEMVFDVIQQLTEGYGKDKELTRVVDDVAVWCVPLVNVDGNHRYIHETRDYDRKNARDIDNNGRLDGWDGVDLYRQYPVHWGGLDEIGSRSWPWHYRYRGKKPGSEPEIQAMMALADRERFAVSVDYHTNATKILVPYTDPSMTNPDVNEAWLIAEKIAAALPPQINKKKYEVARNLYPVDGTAQDWFRFEHGTIALLVEAPQHNPLPYEKLRNGNVIPGRGIWRELLRAVSQGPSIRIIAKDKDDAPVVAVVTVVEHAPKSGERWTTRARDGLLVRLVPEPGTYSVVIERDGKTIRRTVEVDGVETLTVRF